jgi:hypothetical protein
MPVGLWTVLPHGHADQLGPRVPERLEGAPVGRLLDEHLVAPADQCVRDQPDRVLCAGGDEDLCGLGGQALAGVPVGDRGAQQLRAFRVVPVGGDLGGQLFVVESGERVGDCRQAG